MVGWTTACAREDAILALEKAETGVVKSSNQNYGKSQFGGCTVAPWDAACTLEELDPVLFITVDRIAWLDLKEDGAPVEPSSDFFGFGLRGALASNRRARCPVLSWEGLP